MDEEGRVINPLGKIGKGGSAKKAQLLKKVSTPAYRVESIWEEKSDIEDPATDQSQDIRVRFQLSENKWYNNIYIVAPCAYGTAIFIGAAFYTWSDGKLIPCAIHYFHFK